MRPQADITAEAWVVYEDDRVVDGLQAGRTLGEVAEWEGETLIGSKVVALTGRHFRS